MMVSIKAILHFYNDIRKEPFSSGYRPAFDFESESLTSGRILLENEKLFYPGEKGEVKIEFLFKEFLKNKLKVGEKVYFYEGPNRIGEIEITEIFNK